MDTATSSTTTTATATSTMTTSTTVLASPSSLVDNTTTNKNEKSINTFKGWNKPAAFKSSDDEENNSVHTTPLSMAQIISQQEKERELKEQHMPQNETEEEEMIRLAMEISLQEENKQQSTFISTSAAAAASSSSSRTNNAESEEDLQLRLAMEESLLLAKKEKEEDLAITLAMVNASEGTIGGSAALATASASASATVISSFKEEEEKGRNNTHCTTFEETNPSTTAVVATSDASGASAAASGVCDTTDHDDVPTDDELRRIVLQKEEDELQASLELALKLQSEEDEALAVHEGSKHHGNYNNGSSSNGSHTQHHVGVRTITQEEFHKLKGNGTTRGSSTTTTITTTKSINPAEYSNYYADIDDTYYYDDDEGYRMNSKAFRNGHGNCNNNTTDESLFVSPQRGTTSKWTRSSKGQNSNIIVGGKDGNEIRTKHDIQLKNISNARRMGLNASETGGNSGVSDRAYNSLKNKTSKHTHKGVATSGTGRAENLQYEKTRQGAIDGKTLRELQLLVNDSTLITHINGSVKEGKEALVYHANGTSGVSDSGSDDNNNNGNNGDVAIKIFKHIQEFKLRSKYVDGDPRYKTKFNQNNKRIQVNIWCEKEYRNLLRAYRNYIPTPKPLLYKHNILCMTFLGEDGWPSPQLREIKIKYGSSKWKHLYCECMMLVRKLVQCARLIHGDLSEYNILLVPSYLLQQDNDKEKEKEESNQISHHDGNNNNSQETQLALIDFGQAVTTGHPNAIELLDRDLNRLSTFFQNKGGVNVLSLNEIKQYILEEVAGTNNNNNDVMDDNNDDNDNNDDDDDDNNNCENKSLEEIISSKNEITTTTTTTTSYDNTNICSNIKKEKDGFYTNSSNSSSSSCCSIDHYGVVDIDDDDVVVGTTLNKNQPRCVQIGWNDDVEYNKLMSMIQ